MKHPFLKSNRKIIISHRGNTFGKDPAKENTIKAFRQCMDIDILEGIELDVDQTQDGRLVVYHRNSSREKPASGLTYAQLKKIKPVPTFKAALQNIRKYLVKGGKQGRILIDVEIKKYLKYGSSYAASYEYDVMALLTSFFHNTEFIVSSFRFPVLRKIIKKYPEVTRGLLIERKRKLTEDMLKALDFIAPRWDYFHFYKNINKPFLLWTVNCNRCNEFLANIPAGHDKVKGLITDVAGKLH